MSATNGALDVRTTVSSRDDTVLLLGRLLLVVLFILFGFNKLTSFTATIGQMKGAGLPLPELAAAIAVIMEFFVGIAIALGFWTRTLAVLLAIYTLATAFISHRYWTMTGPAQFGNEINFYKNLSIIGGLLLLSVTGPGRYSINRH